MAPNTTEELIKSKDGQHYLVVWMDDTTRKYVVCSYYDSAQPVGSQWAWGHYFDELCPAVAYWNENNY